MRRALIAALAWGLVLSPSAQASDPLRAQQWGLSMVEADAAHGSGTGAGALVAVIDTGAALWHADLQGRLVAGRDFVDGDSDPRDGNGHGTHVTGIAAANAGNGVGVSSVAPGTSVLVVRVLDSDGYGTVEDVVAGIDYAVAQGAHVINLSLGDDGTFLFGPDPGFSNAIDRALDRGVVVVAAAGNSGLPACEQPSGQGRLLCVGSVDRHGNRSFFSSFGQGLGLVAPGGATPFGTPGEDVLSTYTRPDYEWLAGTSQAAPHVSGVAALLVSKGLRGQAVANRILETASDVGPPGPDPEYGAGIVNARRAVAGLGGQAAPGAPAGRARQGSAVRISLRRRQRIRTVLRRGMRVRCRAAGAGRCRVVATRKRRRILAGSARLRPGRSALVRARATKRGRGLLRRALRRRARLRLRVVVRVPGARPVVRRVLLVP